jgi:hypothetical protein
MRFTESRGCRIHFDANTSSRVYSVLQKALSAYSIIVTLDSPIGGKHSYAREKRSSLVGSSSGPASATDCWRGFSNCWPKLLRLSVDGDAKWAELVEGAARRARFSLSSHKLVVDQRKYLLASPLGLMGLNRTVKTANAEWVSGSLK